MKLKNEICTSNNSSQADGTNDGYVRLASVVALIICIAFVALGAWNMLLVGLPTVK
jgi:hypothetical protein